jgi:lipopolysaccharide export system permease protein
MLTLLDRYIGRSMLLSTLLVFGVFAALFFFVSLVEALGDYGKGHFGVGALLTYVVLSQPRKLYEIFPVTALIGTLLGLSALALNSELIAIRAAGVSKARIVGATMKTGAVLVILAILAGEYVVPGAETSAQTGRAQALEMSFKQGNTGLWLRDGTTFVNIGEVLPDLSLLRIDIYDIAADYTLRRHVYANRAVYADRRWELKDVQASRITNERVQTEKEPVTEWHAGFTPAVVAVFTTRPEALSIMQLYAYIRHLRSNNQDVGRYVLAFWQKCFMPLAAGIMILLAAPFVFRPVRSGGLAQRAFVGVVLGLIFVVVNRSVGYLGLIYGVPPLAAAVAPLVMFFGIAVLLMRRMA